MLNSKKVYLLNKVNQKCVSSALSPPLSSQLLVFCRALHCDYDQFEQVVERLVETIEVHEVEKVKEFHVTQLIPEIQVRRRNDSLH